MADKVIIEVNEYQRLTLIDALNEKRNSLVERFEDGSVTEHIDAAMVNVMCSGGIIEVSDLHRRHIVNSLNMRLQELREGGLDTGEVQELLRKANTAPTKKEWKKLMRERQKEERKKNRKGVER